MTIIPTDSDSVIYILCVVLLSTFKRLLLVKCIIIVILQCYISPV